HGVRRSDVSVGSAARNSIGLPPPVCQTRSDLPRASSSSASLPSLLTGIRIAAVGSLSTGVSAIDAAVPYSTPAGEFHPSSALQIAQRGAGLASSFVTPR